MTPREFIEKWRDNPLKERASYQLHFIDLCALLGVPTPSPSSHETYCFERGAARTGAGQGWADVWKKGFFGFEYKAMRRNLGEALKQLMTYALALDNPPLLVVCDTNIIEIHTHFTNAPSEVHTIALEDIASPSNLDKLRWLFTDPDKFHPQRTISEITEEAAGKFAALAQSLNARGHAPQTVAHFLNQCLFCLFAEDAELLPGKLFERLLDKSQADPAKLSSRFEELFNAMRKGGDFALEDIHWFNGGLFETVEVLPLITSEITTLHAAAKLNWSGIEPSIFGTLFERGLDPKKRSQLGAHYTDQQSILRIINPVIVEPLAAEWEAAKRLIAERMALYEKGGKGSKNALQEAQGAFIVYLERLKNFKVLDPACGSGNFLYLALRALKDLEHKANLEAEQHGLHRQVSIEASPANVLGIELNPYAAELARVTVWIGEIQWMLKNGYPIRKNPILQPLDHIENRDAVLLLPSPASGRGVGGEGEAVEAQWPTVDAIIGNPPFLGGSKMRGELSDDYTEALRNVYEGRVPGGADLVTYWFEKTRAQIEAGNCQRAGLVATNSIRGGSNQQVLARICGTSKIFNAWSDEEWINEGAAVRVSLVCFASVIPAQAGIQSVVLNGQPVETIHADLTAGAGLNLTQAKPLKENAGVCFMGASKKGAFDIDGDLARQWLKLPNPNGRPNSDVLKPLWNGLDVARRPRDGWIIDFGTGMSEADAALYEAPFEYVTQHVKPEREKNNREAYRKYWWRHAEARPGMRKALTGLPRYIATPEVAKHRIFVWMDKSILPDQKLYAIARSDNTTFGILHSCFHELWALAVCSWHGAGNDPRYTPTTTFETFQFPEGLTPNLVPSDYANTAATEIATAAQELNKLRENWLNPPEWVDWVRTPEEEKAGYPARPVAKPGHEADLKKRTLTNLYNARPAWLDNAHKTLDAAVAKAYGWNDYTPEMPDEEILRRLLALNLARAEQ
ncbi:DNA methyltransferase [Sulfuricella sp. T08]|uniref:class I SAM-dependent DNA methyltransferase n=1 Tax=Sulfuricella sp. T08 TaxID=1632857 RepID=UPI00061797DF|nr:DNA methyltransferase [Sulfuricella sp. T08]GAO37586.1 DNA methyltransferase [Sulfuricella sp. T08]